MTTHNLTTLIDYVFTFQKSGDYMAIPITCNVVLIISDTLLIWASSAKTRRERLLTWPWLLLHCAEWLFFLAIMIFAMYLVSINVSSVVEF